MIDMDTSLTRNDLDGLVYKNMQGVLNIKNKSTKFNVDIRHHHNLIRYKMIVLNKEDELSLKIVDRDYNVKL